MSGIVNGAVMQHGPRQANLAWTLSAIAEAADDHGFAVLSQESIALKIRRDRRTTIRHLEKLERDGWLRIEHRVLGKGNVYFINIERLRVELHAKSRRSPLWDEVERLLAERKRASMSGVQKRLELRWVAVDEVEQPTPVSRNLFPSSDKMSPQSEEIPDPLSFADVTKKSVEVTKTPVSSDILDIPIRKNRVNPEPKDRTPLPPSSARGGRPHLVDASAPGESNDNGKSLPDEGEVRTLEAREVAAAVAKVMRECSLSEPRMRGVIERALRTEAAKTDEAARWNEIAERMTAAHTKYRGYLRAGVLRYPVRMRRFIAEGIWRDEGLWAFDEDRFQRMNRRF